MDSLAFRMISAGLIQAFVEILWPPVAGNTGSVYQWQEVWFWVSSSRCWRGCRWYRVSSSVTRRVALTWRWTCLVYLRTLCGGNSAQKSSRTTQSTRSTTRTRSFSIGLVSGFLCFVLCFLGCITIESIGYCYSCSMVCVSVCLSVSVRT